MFASIVLFVSFVLFLCGTSMFYVYALYISIPVWLEHMRLVKISKKGKSK